MARRVNAGPGTDNEQNLSDAPPMVGGAPGIIEGATSVLSEPGKPQASIPKVDRGEVVAKLPPQKRWIVERGGRVMYGGCGVEIKVGKIIEENHYDVGLLLRQGIVLKEI